MAQSPLFSSHPDLMHVGTLVRPHGIKGEMCVDLYVDNADILRGILYLKAGNQPPAEVKNAQVRMHQGRALLRLPHIPDRTAAEMMRGVQLLVPQTALPKDSDDIFCFELIGLQVILHKENAELGTLDAINFLGEQELWTITTPEGHEVLLPAVPEFVHSIDLEKKTIHITPPDGLLEIYLEDKE